MVGPGGSRGLSLKLHDPGGMQQRDLPAASRTPHDRAFEPFELSVAVL